MSVDAKCYECISGAGLEPILDKRYINSKTPFTLAKEYPKDVLLSFQQDPSVPPSMKEKLGVAMGLSGGRGQASGFIMRMMAENKKKHQGQYRNPSDNDYGSTMNKFRAFDYDRLANADQNGNNQSDYGASPFIIKHFGSPDAVPFIPKAQRGSEEHRVIEGETEEQKAARLNAKSEELAQLAKDLLEKSAAKGKIKGFLKGRIAVKKAKELLQQKKAETYAEKLRLMKEAEKKDFEKSAREYAGELRTEWSKIDRAIADYLEYKYKGETGAYSRRSRLRELMKEFFERKMKEKFPNFQKRFDKLGYNERSRIIPSVSYDGPSYSWNYKTLSYAEAKKIYDATFPSEDEETAEEKAERTRGLKGVIRRIIRTRQTLKAQAGKLALPKWWDGVQCVMAWGKATKYPHGPDDLYTRSWFGKTLYYASGHRYNRFFVADYEPIPEEPHGKSKKAEEARKEYNRVNAKSGKAYKEVGEALEKLGTSFMKWVFTIALPTKGYNLVEYHPTEATFPQVEVIETREGLPLHTGKWSYHKTGKFRPSGTRFLIGTNKEGYNPEKDSVPPLPDVITLLLHPDGKLAWLISSKTGDERWASLARSVIGDRVSGDTGFSFNVKFRKVGDQFIHIIPDYIDGSPRQSEKPQMVGDIEIKEVLNSQTLLGNNPPKPSRDHITWAYPEGIAQIIKNLYDDLRERKEWSGTPLVSIDLVGAGRKRR